MPQPSSPRKGSLGFGPRTRATDEVPRVRSWPDEDGQPRLQGFAGYKAGMTHVIAINDEANSPLEGTEETIPVTIIEVPPIGVASIRAYADTPYGRQPVGEIWAADDVLDDDLERVVDLPGPDQDREDPTDAFDPDEIDDVAAVVYTRPGALPSVPRKAPQVMEIRIGGEGIEARLETASELLANGEVSVADVFRAGQFIDVSAVTKGKGTQGPVKRWGVQKRKGKHARQGFRRRIGNLGPWHPSRVRSTVPQQGQTGYHQRTEHNKRILALGDEENVTPDGGFVNYGEVDGDYLLVKGSVPGPQHRLIRLRAPIRATEQPRLDPEVRYVSTASNQG